MAGKKKGRRTVVALLALSAVASHVAETAAGVAGLRTAAEAATVAAKPALGTVARDVTDLAALVAFLATAHAGAAAAVHVTGAGLGAFTGDVARVAAAVAGLRLRGYGAFSAWSGIVLVGWCWWRGQATVYLLTWPWPVISGAVSEENTSWCEDLRKHTVAVVALQKCQ